MMLPTIETSDATDRRRRPRLKLAYPLRLYRVSNGSRIDTQTEDISCEGFFCVTESVLSLRERLDCELVISSDDDGQPMEETMVLRCRAEVVRVVSHHGSGVFGVGCRLADYTIECETADLALNPPPEVTPPLVSVAARNGHH